VQAISRFILAFSIFSLALGATATAQEADDSRARMHFDAGRSYYDDGAYEQALQEFRRAYDLSRRPAMLNNMAQCEERLGMWNEAAAHLEEFARTLPEGSEDRARVDRRVANLRARVAGRSEEPEPSGPSQPAGPTQPAGRPASDGLLVPSIVLMGAGAAALITWGVLGGMALGEESSVANGCGATMSCTPDEVRTMDDLALGADITMALGLALAATGAILLVVDPPRGASNEVSVAPFVGPGTAGVALGGSL
jgi:tetratricopeptide (TPR) repeat protein